tara:strand:- start:686 stop:1132 length:447 start_codon:yes stop_codon:yes gene_type:complete
MAISDSVSIYGEVYSNPILKGNESKRTKTYGVGFPFGSQRSGGYFHKDADIQASKANIRQLLLTERGERIMLPNYGVSLKKYLFEPLDEATFEDIKSEVVTSLSRYARGVQLLRIRVTPFEESGFKIELVLKLLEEEEAIFDVKIKIQ